MGRTVRTGVLTIALAGCLAGCGGTTAPVPSVPVAPPTLPTLASAAPPATPSAPATPEPTPGPTSEPTPEPTSEPTPDTTGSPSASPAQPTPAATLGGLVTGLLPVVDCEMDDATGDVPQESPDSLEATLPSGLIDAMAWHWNGRGSAWLGPANWLCTGLVAGNGTSSVALVNPDDDQSAITYTNAATSYAYVLEIACPLFPEAAAAYAADFGAECTAPEGEQADPVAPTLVRFFDPPDVEGTGDESGRGNPATGAVFYDGATALKMTCVLPETGTATCRALVDAFVAAFVGE